jgi:hypothetical protein
MFFSLLYMVLRAVFRLALAGDQRDREVENLVLRHQVKVWGAETPLRGLLDNHRQLCEAASCPATVSASGATRLVHDPRELRAATRRMLAMTIARKPVVAVLLEKAIAVGRWVDDADSYLQPRADPHRGWSVSGGGMDSQACPTGR